MIRLGTCFIGLVALAGYAVALQSHYYNSADGNIKMTFIGMRVEQGPNLPTRVLLNGGVHITSAKDKLEMFADHAIALFVTKSGATTLKSVHAVGSVKLIKHNDQKGQTRVSTISSQVADYVNSATLSTADFNGSVILTDASSEKHTAVRATGTHGHAEFLGGIQSKNSTLAQAELEGSVIIHIDQAGANGGSPGKMVIHCSKMNYMPAKDESALLTLTGEVSMQGTGGAMPASMGNFDRVTIHLNAKHEAPDFNLGAGN